MNTLWKNALVLAVICALAALSLGVVNELTAERIAQRLYEEEQMACQMAFCDAEEFELMDLPEEAREMVADQFNVEIVQAYQALGAGELLGYVFQMKAWGYGGPIVLMIGISREEERIVGIEIQEHQETPGLGSNITGPDFLDQFRTKSLDDPFETGQDIEVIAGATVSSRAVLDASRGAVRFFEEVIQ